MSRIDLSSLAPALRKLYVTEKVQDLVWADRAFMGMLKKEDGFGSNAMSLVVKYGRAAAGASNTFATAQANVSAPLMKEFVVTRAKDYFVGSLDSDVIDAANNNKYSLLNSVADAFDDGLKRLADRLAMACWGTGSGAIGQVLAGSTSTSFTLKNIYDVVKFEVGISIVFSTADGTGIVKSSTNPVYVTAVNRTTGVITCTVLTNVDSTAGAATDDYIFVAGDYGASVKGIRAWIPDTDPTSTAFFTVDRTADINRLAGLRYDGSSVSIEEALCNASAMAYLHGANPKTCFLNPIDYNSLEKSLMGRVIYTSAQVGNILFQGIKINGQNGPIEIFSDAMCPKNRAFLLDMDTWVFKHIGGVPHVLDLDNLKMLRESAADAYEFRMGYKGQLVCKQPIRNVNIKLA